MLAFLRVTNKFYAPGEQRAERVNQLFDTIARHFEPWRQRHARLSRELRDQPYLIPPVS